MIVLDTNVVSELMRLEPHPAVRAWVAGRPRAELFIASASKAEILYGIALLGLGRRQRELALAAEAMFVEDFAGRILPFDAAAAVHYARLAAARRQSGRPIEAFDALIAATAAAAGAAIATRDAGGFAGCGLTVLDPWQE